MQSGKEIVNKDKMKKKFQFYRKPNPKVYCNNYHIKYKYLSEVVTYGGIINNALGLGSL